MSLELLSNADELTQNRFTFIQVPQDLLELSEVTFNAAEQYLMEEDDQAHDEKTMFPKSLVSVENFARKVIQEFDSPRNTEIPEKLKPVQQLMRKLCNRMSGLTYSLIRAISTVHNLSHDTTLDLSFNDEWVLNVVHYPFVPENAGKVLFPAHKDWGTLAIYPFVRGAGLQRSVNGQDWTDIEVPQGTMLAYGGLILQKVSPVPAMVHRVIQPVTDAPGRTSMIFYADTQRDMVLPDGQTVQAFMDDKLRKIGQIK